MVSVLVGIDGSPESSAALRWAGWFAATTHGALRVAHAWQHGARLDPLAGEHAVGADPDGLEARVREELRAVTARELGDAADATYVALRGETATALVKDASARPGSLLVVGAIGAGRVSRALLGSVSGELTTCPVHPVAVVPAATAVPAAGPWSMVVGVDGSTGSSRALRWAARVAAEGDGTVVAVHAAEAPVHDMTGAEWRAVVSELTARLDEEWCAPLRHAGVDYTATVKQGDPRAVIVREAEATSPACVVLGSRGLGSVAGALLGSVTHALVRDLDTPVVVIPAPRDLPVWPV